MIERVLRGLDWLDDHPWVTAALLAAMAAGGAALLALVQGLPAPGGADEFSYLLAADTFASGRLANPAHPFWQHFETFHVLQQPTYVSKYPPAQGLVLAFGQAAGGHPVVGVWLSIAMMVASMYWMFRAWIPGRWAVFGGLLVVMQLGVSSYWAQSYWGGAVAATGGALLFGAVRRLADEPAVRDALLLGIGVAILANSRPFEGLIVSLFAAAALAWALFRNGPVFRDAFLRRAVLPILIVITITGSAMATYNHVTTGDVFRMPYQVYSDTYSMGSFLPWKEPRLDLEFRHEIMREYAEQWGVQRLSVLREPGTFAVLSAVRTLHRAWFFLGVLLVAAIVGLPRALRSGWFVLAALIVATLWIVSLFTTAYPHYVAPATAPGFAVAVEAARRLSSGSEKMGFGRSLVLLIVILELVHSGSSLFRPQYLTTRASPVKVAFSEDRAEVIERLAQESSRDLVFVRYGQGHSFHREWVYNRADIDAASIVWARDMGRDENRKLLEYFPDRSAWLLTATGGSEGSVGSIREHVSLESYTVRTDERHER